MKVTVPKWFLPAFQTATVKDTILAITGGGGSSDWDDITNKPTTISGYGITDAKIVSGTIILGSDTITPLTSFTETDPTVPSWAKAASKPSYNFSEIGSTPTTLSGYGITDANISGGVITLGSDTITPITSHQSLDGVTAKTQAIPYIEGPSTDSAGVWTGSYTGITAYADGLTIIYVPGKAGKSGGSTLNINNLGDIPCYYTNTAVITTQYAVGVPILLTYRTVSGDGRWMRADYDSNTNTYIRIYRQTSGYNDDYPIVVSRTKTIGTAGTDASYTAVYGVVHDTTQQPTVNPSTGVVKAASFQGSLAWSNVTSTPTTLSGYGITDAKIESGVITLGSDTITPLTSFTETDPTVPSWAKASSKPSYNFSEIGSTPTTISGYGITDAQKSITISSSEPTSGDGSDGDIWIVI